MSSVRFDHVTKIFPDSGVAAVQDVTLEIPSGNFVVLLGPSGCGKTTLLKMVNRLFEPTSGTVYVNGVGVQSADATTLRRQIGYVIQQVGLFPHLTVEQNIAIVPELIGWDKARIVARVNELLELVGLPPAMYRRRFPSQLSGGQQQRVGLARALAADPHLLLMDEPFGAIDAITRAALQDEMLRLKRALNKTVLFVTHDVEEALRLADCIVVLRAGHVIQYDTPFRLLTEPADSFVRELVSADDMVRQLRLLSVSAAMQPLPTDFVLNGTPTIAADANLRVALSELLQTGAPRLIVVEKNRPVGQLNFDNIRASRQARKNS